MSREVQYTEESTDVGSAYWEHINARVACCLDAWTRAVLAKEAIYGGGVCLQIYTSD